MNAVIWTRGATAFASLCWLASAASAQTCENQTCLVDRGATGEINLGFVRGGLAVLDYDADGFPDLVIGDNVGPNRLFHNQPDPLRMGSRTFVDVTAGSGLDDSDGISRFSFGVVAADYDNDGDADLFMTGNKSGATPNGLLYRNDGGHFANVSLDAGIRPGCFHRAASWSDYNLDGWVDLFVVCNDSNPMDYILHQNNRDGSFTSWPGRLPITLPALGISYAHMWTDYDNDGYDDVFILSTEDRPILLRNVADALGGRRLTDVAGPVGFGALGPAPMGIAMGDYDNDGDFDIGVTDAATGTYYENTGGAFERVFPFETDFSWGITWLDVDNDGDLDHYQCGALGAYQRFDSLIRNMGNGQWEDINATLNGVSAQSQHSVQIDFNNDGRQDLITINPGSPPHQISVYENISTTGNHWITVRLQGDGEAINLDAIGAVVRLTAGGLTQVRQVQSGSSTTSTEDLRIHFGLGTAVFVDQIEVRWPAKGSLEDRSDVYDGPFAVDQIISLTPRLRACCVCPDQACTEQSLADCRAAGGTRYPDTTCATTNCAANSPAVARAPTAVPGGDPLNRYLAFVPENPGRPTAIRITLESLYRPDPGIPDNRFLDYEGLSFWLGPPVQYAHSPAMTRFYYAAQLQCEPFFTDWSIFETMYVYGPEVLPSSRYTIREVKVTCGGDWNDTSTYSAPLTVTTARWGDLVSPFAPPSQSLQPDFGDVSSIIDTFRDSPYALGKTRCKLVPDFLDPDQKVNFADISACVDAFRGMDYSLAGPQLQCP